MSEQDALDAPNLNVKEYFKNYIKTKKIEELIATDNKLFSEVRNLESEKHVLVTQNYKKFVSATETINTIKSSLLNFEKDLLNLKGKVQNLVSNFNTINAPLDGKLKETEEMYKIKKDLKRLKFINDLPNILNKHLTLYNNDQEKKLSNLEKPLIYYEKCKEFIQIHKDNTLVKDIYNKSNELIYQYKSKINDKMDVKEFNEFEIEKFETCIGLLVKIEDNKEELMKTFIDRYQFLISGKFDNLFSFKEGVEEISFQTYNKIYDNYEFAINENDFLFYESQINGNNNIIKENNIKDNNNPEIKQALNISSLQSKSFKKGTFIWICKKVCENILGQIMFNCYQSYIKLFGIEKSENINILLFHCIDIFNKKILDYLENMRVNSNNNNGLDPVFFKDGLLSFYKSFLSDLIAKMEDKNIKNEELISKIIENNKQLLNVYIIDIHCNFINETCKNVNDKINILQTYNKKNSDDLNIFIKFNKSIYVSESEDFCMILENILSKYAIILRNLNLDNFNENDNLGAETDLIYQKHLISIFSLFIMIIHSSNIMKFNSNSYENYFDLLKKENNYIEIISKYKDIIRKNLKKDNLEIIYFFLTLSKLLLESNTLKLITDKFLYEFQQIKKNKNSYNEIKQFIEKEITNNLSLLYDSIIQRTDNEILSTLKILFLDINWVKKNESPATFRLELKKLCYELYQLKLNLMEILEEEGKLFKETKMGMMESFIPGNNKVKSLVQIEMEQLQIRRLNIYGEIVESPQMIIYVIIKIFLKTLNEFIKLKKFSCFGYQQIQCDLGFIHSFFKENLVFVDVENILDGFQNEIIKNCEFNTFGLTNENKLNNDLINDMIQLHNKEFKNIYIVVSDSNNEEINTNKN